MISKSLIDLLFEFSTKNKIRVKKVQENRYPLYPFLQEFIR